MLLNFFFIIVSVKKHIIFIIVTQIKLILCTVKKKINVYNRKIIIT